MNRPLPNGTGYHFCMKLSRLGAVSIGLVVGSTLAGGVLGQRALAGGGRLNEQRRLYTAMLNTGAQRASAERDARSDSPPLKRAVRT